MKTNDQSDKPAAESGVGCSALLGRCPRCGVNAVLCNNWEMLSKPGMTTVFCAACRWNDAIPVIYRPGGTVERLPVPARWLAQKFRDEPAQQTSADTGRRPQAVTTHNRLRESGTVIETDAQASLRKGCSDSSAYEVRPNEKS